jgi:hypothetical protein
MRLQVAIVNVHPDPVLASERFGYPQAGARRGLCRQRASFEEAAGNDLTVRFGRPILAKIPDQVDGDVVAPGHLPVKEHPKQDRLAQYFDASLLRQLPSSKLSPGSTPPPGKCQPAT